MDFEQARFNMVEQQIRPWEVLDPAILDLLFHVKREDFVAEQQRALAFTDVELPLPNGGRMLQPKQEARMVQDLSLQPGDKVLEVGTGSGYVTALLAKLTEHVYSVECHATLLHTATDRLRHAGIGNVTLIEGNGLLGLEKHAPFDAIFVGGSVPVVPETLKQQLAIGGRMIVTVGDEPVMTVRLIHRISENDFSESKLYETVISRLSGSDALEPERFVF
ncbi:MAG: protein-L-isoaspartate O-methyltransferase [Paludibacterium sp.]|uniref:protein-L-isoaspartate O-methyltransferase family protein n=1 Tax=Paludibacterium sp. TaxID=1917523 RepID=UPI0025E86EA4|nr:protein-L-isoaspartate O-methyltransferase [Paludibacterium sp.]MBV8047632.1 protein-L-isoaspartate O-methyltransferase [Paludibacterium sp.]MBV8649435.1 protein-L-isoaspartate O-methyltransferase [Paludibacterium sp.]